ncbi:hypothetical protein BDV40DRAFT_190456 [Aspergillus tamarii]|uniref:Uncharacterized protein n=1 Tax=Aspergillus tamarii TaxID=41984 RepID=A0A5N6V883_ASPTM|nr:hypothetical protein BDV40DRAFT_190456 [Aspergillus tamarii]
MLKFDIWRMDREEQILHSFPVGSQPAIWQCTRANKINRNRGCHECHEKSRRKSGFMHVTTLHTAASSGPIFLLLGFQCRFIPSHSQTFISLLPPPSSQCRYQTYTSVLMIFLGIQHSFMKISVVSSLVPSYSMSIVLRWVNFAAPSLLSPAVPGPTDIS